jgi:hypothetical protein
MVRRSRASIAKAYRSLAPKPILAASFAEPTCFWAANACGIRILHHALQISISARHVLLSLAHM